MIQLLHSLDAGSFFELPEGHVLFTQDMAPCTLEVGPTLPLTCMFTIQWLLRDQQKVGFLFTTQFYVQNEGGYLLAYMKSGRGKATQAHVLTKSDKAFILYDFPNRGTLAVSPKVGPQVLTILEEQ